MPQAVVAVAAVIGAEAIGVALGTVATWSWTAVAAKAPFSASVSLVTEAAAPPHMGYSDEPR